MARTSDRNWQEVSHLARKHPLPPATLADMALGKAGCAFLIAQADSRGPYWSVVVGTNQGAGQDYRSEEAALEVADELLRRIEGPAHAALLAEAGLDASAWALGTWDDTPVFQSRIDGMDEGALLRPRPDGLYDLTVGGRRLAEAADRLDCLMLVEREREAMHTRRRNTVIENLMEDQGDLRAGRTRTRLQVLAMRVPARTDLLTVRTQATRPGMSRRVYEFGTADGTLVDTLCVPDDLGRTLGVGVEVEVIYGLAKISTGAEWHPVRVEMAPEPEPTIAP